MSPQQNIDGLILMLPFMSKMKQMIIFTRKLKGNEKNIDFILIYKNNCNLA